VPFAAGRPSGEPVDVMTGFLSANDEAFGRPAGLNIDRSGALLIADDVGNVVWRVSAIEKFSAKKTRCGLRPQDETPLDYMIRVMRDENVNIARKDWATQAAAPYLHPRLITAKIVRRLFRSAINRLTAAAPATPPSSIRHGSSVTRRRQRVSEAPSPAASRR
jgi:hypothetical protein